MLVGVLSWASFGASSRVMPCCHITYKEAQTLPSIFKVRSIFLTTTSTCQRRAVAYVYFQDSIISPNNTNPKPTTPDVTKSICVNAFSLISFLQAAIYNLGSATTPSDRSLLAHLTVLAKEFSFYINPSTTNTTNFQAPSHTLIRAIGPKNSKHFNTANLKPWKSGSRKKSGQKSKKQKNQ